MYNIQVHVPYVCDDLWGKPGLCHDCSDEDVLIEEEKQAYAVCYVDRFGCGPTTLISLWKMRMRTASPIPFAFLLRTSCWLVITFHFIIIENFIWTDERLISRWSPSAAATNDYCFKRYLHVGMQGANRWHTVFVACDSANAATPPLLQQLSREMCQCKPCPDWPTQRRGCQWPIDRTKRFRVGRTKF